MVQHAEDIIVDKKEQLEKIEEYCLPNETIRAVFDLKGIRTGFVAVLDKRVIFYDKAFTHKGKAMVTVPYNRIHAVSSEDDPGVLHRHGLFSSSKLILHTGNDSFEFEFRGGDKANQAYIMIMEYLLQ